MIQIENIVLERTSWHLPRFLLQPIIRLLHEREINDLLRSGSRLAPREFLHHVFRQLNLRSDVLFTSPLDPAQRYLFVANHPFGALDGMMLADMLLSRWDDVGVVVNDILMHIEPLRELWIPVCRGGRHNLVESEHYRSAFASERQILTFPAGLCSRWERGRVTDLGWKPRFVRDAERYDRRIVPVYVDGELSRRFYYIYRLRRALRISLNVELLLLVDELFAQRGRRVRIVVGQPIDVGSLRGNTIDRCRAVREEVYSLK